MDPYTIISSWFSSTPASSVSSPYDAATASGGVPWTTGSTPPANWNGEIGPDADTTESGSGVFFNSVGSSVADAASTASAALPSSTALLTGGIIIIVILLLVLLSLGKLEAL